MEPTKVDVVGTFYPFTHFTPTFPCSCSRQQCNSSRSTARNHRGWSKAFNLGRSSTASRSSSATLRPVPAAQFQSQSGSPSSSETWDASQNHEGGEILTLLIPTSIALAVRQDVVVFSSILTGAGGSVQFGRSTLRACAGAVTTTVVECAAPCKVDVVVLHQMTRRVSWMGMFCHWEAD